MKYLFLVFLISCATKKPVVIKSDAGQKEIKATLSEVEPDLKRCIDDSDIGKSSFHFQIALTGEGEPEDIEIDRAKKDAKIPKKLQKCLRNVIYETDFPLPKSGDRYEIKHKVNFFPEQSFKLDNN